MYLRQSGDEILLRHPGFHSRMRAILLDWLSEVSDVYKLHRETFYLATDFFDRFLGVSTNIPKETVQLAGEFDFTICEISWLLFYIHHSRSFYLL